jgi:hypothetical protein
MKRFALTFLLVTLVSGRMLAAPPICTPPGSEQFQYSWKLRGALSWIAAIRFPTRGTGELKNEYSANGSLDTQLKITGEGDPGFYLYHSVLDEKNGRTLMTYHGYSWGKKAHNERALFDYVKRLVRIREEKPGQVREKVKPIPAGQLRDVLTGIHYLRQNATTIASPLRTDIYSDGKLYPVVFVPQARETVTVGGKSLAARTYVIAAAPEQGKKWPGAVKVWLTEDAGRVPLRIEMQHAFATLRLDLESAEGCPLR